MTSLEPEPAAAEPSGASRASRRDLRAHRGDITIFWAARIMSLLGVVATILAAVATGTMVQHGHPAYAILLAVVLLTSAVFVVHYWFRSTAIHRRLKPLRWVGIVTSAAVLAVVWWLVPSAATEPSLSAMHSDATVRITESTDQIVLGPAGTANEVGVFFQPGALVDARAYVAILRPLAAAGHTVVIEKQPFGIAFFSLGAFDAARDGHPPVMQWVVGGHSLGGVVSAMDAENFATVPKDAVVGSLFLASYPATEMTALGVPVLSISASNDGLATPAKINAAKSLLPADTNYKVIDGAVHSNFGDYGPQSGDGQPTISGDAARAQISVASVAFVDMLSK